MDFLDRLRGSFDQLALYIPALLGALVILFAGYLLAKLIERGIDRGLNRMGLNHWLKRGGVLDAVERTGWRRTPSRLVGSIAFWFVMFVVILVAAHALGLSSLTNVFSELVSYIPSVIAALVIILVGIVLGEFVDGLLMASAGGIPGGPTLARVGRAGVIILAIFMALQELGIATEIVTTAFAIIFGALALAFALSFGLGNRELAGEITRGVVRATPRGARGDRVGKSQARSARIRRCSGRAMTSPTRARSSSIKKACKLLGHM